MCMSQRTSSGLLMLHHRPKMYSSIFTSSRNCEHPWPPSWPPFLQKHPDQLHHSLYNFYHINCVSFTTAAGLLLCRNHVIATKALIQQRKVRGSVLLSLCFHDVFVMSVCVNILKVDRTDSKNQKLKSFRTWGLMSLVGVGETLNIHIHTYILHILYSINIVCIREHVNIYVTYIMDKYVLYRRFRQFPLCI